MDYRAILETAFAQKPAAERASGCGRVYVYITAKEHRAGIKRAARQLGLKYLSGADAGTHRNSLYVGYDNNDGLALAKGTAVKDALTAAGIECFRDEYDD